MTAAITHHRVSDFLTPPGLDCECEVMHKKKVHETTSCTSKGISKGSKGIPKLCRYQYPTNATLLPSF